MANAPVFRLWLGRLAYLGLCLILILWKLLPFSNGSAGFPAPDLLVLVTVAWLLRKPDAVPVLSVVAVFLMGDILFLQPLGLWAAAMVLLTEFLRRREPAWRELSFPIEWSFVAGALSVVTLAHTVILALFAVDQPALGLTLLRLLITLACYPVIVLVLRMAGVRKSAPGDTDNVGRTT